MKHPSLTCPTCGRPTAGLIEPLTPAQRDTLLFLQGYVAAMGYAPSHREIADSLGLRAKSSAQSRLRELERKGYIRHEERRRRSLTILVEVPT